MAITLPTAPANFYTPSLSQLKTVLETVNGSTKGQAVLLNGLPTNINDCWSEVGVAGDTSGNTNRGSLVMGHHDIGIITGPVLGPEESVGENGYKLQFAEILNMPIYIDGSGTSFDTAIGLAFVEGVDLFANGTANHLRYIFNITPLILTDGNFTDIPALELIINYAEDVVV